MLLWLAICSRSTRIMCGLVTVLAVACSELRTATAQTCGSEYTLREGDTLAQIATRVYGDPAQWTIILYANRDRLGANERLLVPGSALKVPCVSGFEPQRPLPPIATTPAQAATPP